VVERGRGKAEYGARFDDVTSGPEHLNSVGAALAED
jgi:hypothetical protein